MIYFILLSIPLSYGCIITQPSEPTTYYLGNESIIIFPNKSYIAPIDIIILNNVIYTNNYEHSFIELIGINLTCNVIYQSFPLIFSIVITQPLYVQFYDIVGTPCNIYSNNNYTITWVNTSNSVIGKYLGLNKFFVHEGYAVLLINGFNYLVSLFENINLKLFHNNISCNPLLLYINHTYTLTLRNSSNTRFNMYVEYPEWFNVKHNHSWYLNEQFIGIYDYVFDMANITNCSVCYVLNFTIGLHKICVNISINNDIETLKKCIFECNNENVTYHARSPINEPLFIYNCSNGNKYFESRYNINIFCKKTQCHIFGSVFIENNIIYITNSTNQHKIYSCVLTDFNLGRSFISINYGQKSIKYYKDVPTCYCGMLHWTNLKLIQESNSTLLYDYPKTDGFFEYAKIRKNIIVYINKENIVIYGGIHGTPLALYSFETLISFCYISDLNFTEHVYYDMSKLFQLDYYNVPYLEGSFNNFKIPYQSWWSNTTHHKIYDHKDIIYLNTNMISYEYCFYTETFMRTSKSCATVYSLIDYGYQLNKLEILVLIILLITFVIFLYIFHIYYNPNINAVPLLNDLQFRVIEGTDHDIEVYELNYINDTKLCNQYDADDVFIPSDTIANDIQVDTSLLTDTFDETITGM